MAYSVNQSINQSFKKEQANGCASQVGYINIVEHRIGSEYPEN